MAVATRLQTLSKQSDEQRQAAEVITTQIEKLTQSQAQIDELIQSQQRMEAMMAALMSQRSNQLSRPPDPPYSASSDLTSYSQAPQPPDPPDFNQFGQRLSKFEFPKFDGTLLREWFRRYDEYFSLHKTPPEMRVRVASSYMIGKALKWHTDYIRSNFGIFPPWLDYIMAISAKFGDDDAIPIATPLSKLDFTPKSYDEIQARSTKELSVFDEEPYIRDRQLKYKPSQIFVIGCEDATMYDDEKPDEESNPENESMSEVLLSQSQVLFSPLEPSHRCHKTHNHYESLDVVDKVICDEPVCDKDGDYILTVSAKFREIYEDPRYELVCLKQSHDPVENHLDNFEFTLTRSPLRHTPTDQYRAPFDPYQNCNEQCHYKREFGNYTGHEIEFDRECEEIEDDELKDKQPEEDVEILVMSENTHSPEWVDDESSVDEKLIEVIAEETALEPMDESSCKFYKERNLNSLLCQSLRLLHFEESIDTTVPSLNLETKALSSLLSVGGIMLLSDSK